MPPTVPAHSFHITGRSCLPAVLCPIAPSRSSPRLASRRTERAVASSVPARFSAFIPSGFAARLCLLGVASGMACVDLKKRAGVFVFPVRLSVLLSYVIHALVVVVQIALLADDIAVRSAWTDVRIRVAWLEMLAHAETVCPAFDI